MDGTGVPLVTPFDADGNLLAEDLRAVVEWVEPHVDFLVPCGSTSEAPLLGADEQARVTQLVADATDRPVLAGAGTAGYREAVRAIDRAADAGADAALVVTPYYYGHDAASLATYYREVADASPVPVYCYSVPKFTGVALDPETVAEVATHPNVAGIKDSSGDVERLVRHARLTPEDFSVLVGSGSVYAAGLDAGADGGILALANVAPREAAAIYHRHREGQGARARRRNADLVALNRAVTARFGVPGLKAAMEYRGVPAGRPRRPLCPVDDETRGEIEAIVDRALE